MLKGLPHQPHGGWRRQSCKILLKIHKPLLLPLHLYKTVATFLTTCIAAEESALCTQTHVSPCQAV